MGRSQSELERLVCEHFKQQSGDCVEGPHPIGPYRITRVWTYSSKGDEYHAHHTIEEGNDLLFLENFAGLAGWLEPRLNREVIANLRERLIRIAIASIAVLVGLVLLVLLVWQNPSQTNLTYLLTTLIGGGAGFLFGNWSRSKGNAAP